MKALLRSTELTCPSCIAKIENALELLDGVSDAKVHFSTGRIEVDYDPERVKTGELVKTVKSVGYNAQVSAF